jgi:hypothetical protein
MNAVSVFNPFSVEHGRSFLNASWILRRKPVAWVGPNSWPVFFAIGMKHCPSCGSENFKPISAIVEISVIRKTLIHLGLPEEPPDIAPARIRQMSFD